MALRKPHSRVRQLNTPQPARVWLDNFDRPEFVEWKNTRTKVEVLLDSWCVDDAWWSSNPVRRIYHEVQLITGTRLVLSWDLITQQWLAQR